MRMSMVTSCIQLQCFDILSFIKRVLRLIFQGSNLLGIQLQCFIVVFLSSEHFIVGGECSSHVAVNFAIVRIEVDILCEVFYSFREIFHYVEIDLSKSFIQPEVIGKKAGCFFKISDSIFMFVVVGLSFGKCFEIHRTLLELLCFLQMCLCRASFSFW